MKTAPTVSATLAQATHTSNDTSDVTANVPDTASDGLRDYAPSDADTLALALGRAIVREMQTIMTIAPSESDPFAGVVVGKGDRQSKLRALDAARDTLGKVRATYTTKMEALAKQIVATQNDLRDALVESCRVTGVSLPSLAASLGIKIAADMTIAEMSADAKARAAIERQLADAKLDAKREIAEARAAREARAADLRAEKMRLDGFSEIEIEIDRKSRAAKLAAKLAAKQAK